MSTPGYTVRRLGWHQPPHGDPYTRRVPSTTPVATFNTFDEAELHRRVLEAEAREGENPFRFGGGSIFFQSSLDGPRLHDWLMDEAIDPPDSELRHSDWRAWWFAFAHTWSEGQLAHAWAAFDKVRFFDVAEAAPFTAYAAIEYAQDRYWPTESPPLERGRLLSVSRKSRGVGRIRRAPGQRWYESAYAVEVLPIPSDVPPAAGEGFLVQRRAVTTPTYQGEIGSTSAWARVPLALFAGREGANAHRDRLAAEARRLVNPFVFLTQDPAAYFAREQISQLGLSMPLPARDRREDWLEWYDLCQDEATDEQRAGVWELCDRPLFEVLRVEVVDG